MMNEPERRTQAIHCGNQRKANTLWDLFVIPPQVHVTLPSGRKRYYNLTIFQRLFIVLEFSSSCSLAEWISRILSAMVLMNVVCIFAATERSCQHAPKHCFDPVCDHDPSSCPDSIICAPRPLPVFNTIDLACSIVYTIDFSLRMSLVAFMPTRYILKLLSHNNCDMIHVIDFLQRSMRIGTN